MKIMKNKVLISSEEMEELVYESFDNKIIGKSRWETFFEGIVKIKDKHYKLSWSEGSTEIQDTEFNDTEAPEVILQEVVVKKWVEVEKED